VIRGSFIVACLVPIAHLSTCARRGYEESQYIPVLEPGDPGPRWDCGGVDRGIGTIKCSFGVGATLIAALVLLAVLRGGRRWRLVASALYGPLLLVIGLGGLQRPDLHRWLWGSMTTLAGAFLCAFGASHLALFWSRSTLERTQNAVIFWACALALLLSSLDLPAQTANRVLTSSPLSWTYHRAEWRRDPNERILGWKCTTHAGRCDCISTDNQSDRGTCGEQRCCYEWDTLQLVPGGPSDPVISGCFCVSVEASLRNCPSPASYRNVYGVGNYRRETCP